MVSTLLGTIWSSGPLLKFRPFPDPNAARARREELYVHTSHISRSWCPARALLEGECVMAAEVGNETVSNAHRGPPSLKSETPAQC